MVLIQLKKNKDTIKQTSADSLHCRSTNIYVVLLMSMFMLSPYLWRCLFSAMKRICAEFCFVLLYLYFSLAGLTPSHLQYKKISVTRSLILLCCLFFFDLRILITPLVSSSTSYWQRRGNKKMNFPDTHPPWSTIQRMKTQKKP